MADSTHTGYRLWWIGMYYVASCSMGKDSLAVVLRLLEENLPLDEVVFFDMGDVEFACIHLVAEKMRQFLKEKNIKFTVLKPEHPFIYYATEKEVIKRDGRYQVGYLWCGSGKCRWGTHLKLDAISKYLDQVDDDVTEYVGIAADEAHRIDRKCRTHNIKAYPLVEWGMTEKDCLKYCKERGWSWMEEGYDLYDLLDRISCWCCGNKNLKELYNLYRFLPDYFKRLEEMQKQIAMPYRRDGETVFDLRRRFEEKSAQPDIFDFFDVREYKEDLYVEHGFNR